MKNRNRLNRIYGNMKSRCYNPKTQHYADYGGRGITVCDEWLNKEKVKTPTKEMLERITEEDLRKTFSNFKKLVDKMKGKKQSKE